MWLMVFFDLPVGTRTERRHATRFRNYLKRDGFLMLQFSVYARITGQRRLWINTSRACSPTCLPRATYALCR